MTAVLPGIARAPHLGTLGLTLRLAVRELRAGLRGFHVFMACLALGVTAIAGVGSFARSLEAGLAGEGRTILGGDLAFTLVQREASAVERAFLDRRGKVSAAATMRAMARTGDGRTSLVEMKAVDDAYPLYGAVATEPDGDLPGLLASRDGAYGAVAGRDLLARLDVAPGSKLRLGEANVEIRAVLVSEPDKLAGGIPFGPRLLIGTDALRATGLLQPGSVVRWQYRLRLMDNAGDRAIKAVEDEARAALPDAGWEIRTRANASPQLRRNIERFAEYLTLVGLTALLIGGVGVANAVKHYLDRKRDVIATLKSLGATGGRVFSVYLAQVLVLALAGTAIGLIVGAALPFAIAAAFASAIPIPIAPAIHPGELALAVVYGLATAIAFALWPLGRVHDVPVSALFLDEVAPAPRWPRGRYIVAVAMTGAALAALAVALAYDRRIALMFVAAAAAVFAALRLIAALLMALARHAPRPRSTLLRLVIANIHRPGALTPTVVLSLGLGLALLVTLTLIDGNLRRQFAQALPDRAPSFYFVDIQDAAAARFDAFVRARAPDATLERVPMLRGRIVSARGVTAEDLRPPDSASWVLHGDRGISYGPDIPAGSRVVAGQWWPPDYRGPPLVSFEARIAEGLGLKIGDPVVINVLGRNVTATIANLRAVDWETLGINFVMVLSPDALGGAPHAHIATLTYPGGGDPAAEIDLVKAVADAFPGVTIVRVKEALDAVSAIVLDLSLAIRAASAVALVAAVLVLGGALATGHRHRVYDAVVLKTLGATRVRLTGSYALEYLLLGAATALFGVAAGSFAAAFVVTDVMNLRFVWLPGPALASALAALVLTVAFGLAGTFSALGQKPARILRHL